MCMSSFVITVSKGYSVMSLCQVCVVRAVRIRCDLCVVCRRMLSLVVTISKDCSVMSLCQVCIVCAVRVRCDLCVVCVCHHFESLFPKATPSCSSVRCVVCVVYVRCEFCVVRVCFHQYVYVFILCHRLLRLLSHSLPPVCVVCVVHVCSDLCVVCVCCR